MPRKVHTNVFIRRVAPDITVRLRIQIGQVQTGEWKVWRDSTQLAAGTDTDKIVDLGPAHDLYGHLLQVEVRCDDTNPGTDRLAALIALTPPLLQVQWSTDNAGSESPHC